jgi:hypothetical protein
MSNNDSEQTGASREQAQARLKMLNFMNEFKSEDHLLRNIFCVVPTPQIARLLSLYSAYQKIQHVTGDILEFGVWYGQNIILLENLRSIIEPFNKRRTIVGFDSFGPVGRTTDEINDDYYLDQEYAQKLIDQVVLHEKSNILGHQAEKHRIISGDIAETLPEYESEQRVVAAMLVDVPGETELKAILDCAQAHLAIGGILVLDDLNDQIQSDVSKTFIQYQSNYKVSPCPFIPNRAIAERLHA